MNLATRALDDSLVLAERLLARGPAPMRVTARGPARSLVQGLAAARGFRLVAGSAVSNLRMLLGWWEPGTAAVCRRLVGPGEIVVDAGAHVGYFTRILADRVGPRGRVFAFEPHPVNFEALTANTADLEPVEVVPAALSDHVGRGCLVESHASGDMHSLRTAEAGETGTIDVGLTRLDRFLRGRGVPRLGFAKIDVEGHEPEVLRGMGGVLGPGSDAAVVVEVSPGADGGVRRSGEVVDELASLGLDIYAVDERRVALEPVSAAPGPDDARRLSGHDHVNLLATRRDVRRLLRRSAP